MSFTDALALADLVPNKPLAVRVEGVDVAVVLIDDGPDEGVYAIHDECSHAAIPLSEGDVDDCHIECYAHGSRVNRRTGEPDQLPATEPVPANAVYMTWRLPARGTRAYDACEIAIARHISRNPLPELSRDTITRLDAIRGCSRMSYSTPLKESARAV